jgi:hypothetical protein
MSEAMLSLPETQSLSKLLPPAEQLKGASMSFKWVLVIQLVLDLEEG